MTRNVSSWLELTIVAFGCSCLEKLILRKQRGAA